MQSLIQFSIQFLHIKTIPTYLMDFFSCLKAFWFHPFLFIFFLFHQLLSSLFQMKPLGPLVFQAQFCICVYLYRKLEADGGSQHWRWAWKFTREAHRLKFVFLTPASFVENGSVLEVQRPQQKCLLQGVLLEGRLSNFSWGLRSCVSCQHICVCSMKSLS